MAKNTTLNRLRTITQPIPEHSIQSVLEWHTLDCELVTPMYGGGVVSTKVDEDMPIRASSIRGQLRFWWRLLAKQKWGLTGDNLRKTEFALWGGMSDGDEEGKASLVWLRVIEVNSKYIEQWAMYEKNVRNNKLSLKPKSWANAPYALFPAQGKLSRNRETVEEQPHSLLKPGTTWKTQFAFSPSITSEQRNQVIEALRWWANFGGIGSRTRRGLGAIHVNQSPDFPQICEQLTAEQVSIAGCRLIQKNIILNATQAWIQAVRELADFRQKAGVGRNLPSEEAKKDRKPAGRSRFPEPDALRRIQKNLDYDKKHKPEHKAGNIFPRAIFGLPILFHSHQEDALNATVEPSFGDRLASPLILRPIYAGTNNKGEKQWRSSALVLPYQQILNMTVKVGQNNYPIWQQSKADDITPINENNGTNPLDAFLNYFSQQ